MRHLLIALIALTAPSLAFAHQTIELVKAYAFDTTPGMANGAAYVVIKNTGPSEAKLMGVSSDISEFAQVHAHVEDGDIRRMVALDLPMILQPGESLTMVPGGIHLMFLGLNEPLSVGDQIDLTLHFEGRHVRDLEVSVEVFGLEARDDLVGEDAMMHGDMDHSTHDHSGHGDMDASHDDHSGHGS